MKPLYKEAYYRKYWDEYLKPDNSIGKHYINLEGDLAGLLDMYREYGVPEEAIIAIKKTKAQELADACKAVVHEELGVLKRILSGESSFGYTSEFQEVRARAEYRERFDFNCLQLADFKKKYGLK